jgi:hypothetical protein
MSKFNKTTKSTTSTIPSNATAITTSITLPSSATTTGILTSTSGTSWGTLTNTIYNPPSYEPNMIIKGQLIHDLGDSTIGSSWQHEIAVIKVTRNQDGKIIRSKMIKTFWVETLTQGSIEYAASKDPEVSKFEPEEIIIKTLRTIKL